MPIPAIRCILVNRKYAGRHSTGAYGVRFVDMASAVLICIIYSNLLLLDIDIVLDYLFDVNICVFIC